MTTNAEELLMRARQAGVLLTPRLHVEASAGAISPELREALAVHRDEILAYLLGPEGLESARRLRDLFRAACFELAETLGWPRVQIAPHIAIVGGEALWRIYLTRASVPELRERVLPHLRTMLDQIPSPDKDVP